MNNYAVDRVRWSKLSILDQMGNISAEVGRTILAKKSGDQARFNAALARALDLFDATAEAWAQHRSYRLKEILRARDQFVSLFFARSVPGGEDSLERYFSEFAIAARMGR